MTEFLDGVHIGRRIKAARKRRGIRSIRALAEKINAENITEAILMNIEAGRKQDLTVSQLLNIAHALRISPAFLLAPLGRPDDPLDLPHLSDDFHHMTIRQFDAWLTGEPNGPYPWTTPDEREERLQLQAMRELDGLKRERARLTTALDLEQSLEANTSADQGMQPWRSFQTQIDEITQRIDQLRTYLHNAGWQPDGKKTT
jgi:transcriptional regulator with XRE-family HTH domain